MAKKTLVEDTTTTTTSSALVPLGDNAPVIETPPPPFIGFLEEKSGKMVELIQAGVKMGQPYLAEGDKFTPLDPFKYHLYAYKQVWTQYDDKYNLLGTRLSDPANWKSPFKEHFEVLLLVYVGKSIVAARANFRGPKHLAGKTPAKELLAAAQGDWASKSPEHSEAAKIVAPFARFTATATTTKTPAKGKGHPYYKASATVKPTTLAEYKILEKYLGDSESKVKFDAVAESWKSKVEELLQKVV